MTPAFLLLLATGCTSPFEGTWLFTVERDPDAEGTCADVEAELLGESHQWVDIYTTGGDELVVLYEEPLVGIPDGAELVASWEETYSYGTELIVSSIVLDGELERGELTGDLTRETRYELSSNSNACTETFTFSAERLRSDEDRYVAEG